MARVPRAADIGVSSFNVGSASQIDIGVAKEIGRAGNAIGDSVAALGGAFGELAGRVQATEQAGAYSGLMNDLYDADAKIENEAYKNNAPDGSNWDMAGTQFGEASTKWKDDPRWGMLTPKQKAAAENAYRDLSRSRVIGKDSYLERSRRTKVTFQVGKIGESAATSMSRLSLDDERNKDIAPQVYDSRVQAEKDLVFSRIDAMTGTVFNQAEADNLKKQYAAQFVQRKTEFLLRSIEGKKNFIEEYNKLPREERKKAEPSYLGGPGSKVDTGGIGSVSAKYESGGRGVGFISSGKGDPGGKSYGVHQLSGAYSMGAFLRSPEGAPYRDAFQGHSPMSDSFNKIYKQVAKQDPEGFAAAQKAFYTRTHYQPVRAAAEKAGFDVNDRGVQEALFSMGVQHGKAKEIVARAARAGGAQGSPRDQIVALYNARTKYVAGLTNLPGRTKQAVLNRYRDEVKDALALSGTAGDQPQVADAASISRPPGMMTLGAGDVEVAENVADRAGIDLSRLKTANPESTLGDELTEEEIAVLEARAPDIDVRKVTVAEAAQLVGQVTGAPPTMNDAEPQVQAAQAPDEDAMALRDDAEMKVPLGNGYMPYSAEEMKYISSKMVRDIEKEFKAQRNAAAKLNEQNAKQMMELQEKSLENTYQDSPSYNQQIIETAFPRGTPEREKYERNVAVGRQLGKIFGKESEMSGLELKERMEAFAPATPPKDGDALLYAGLREKAQKKYDAIMQQRRDDPAAAVQNHPLVQKTLAQFQNGRPQNAEDRVKLARARMAAQQDIGIDPWLRSPIDDGEAKAYVSDLDKIPDDRLEEGLRGIMETVKKQYGEEHSGVVLNAIVREMANTDERKAMLVQTARQLSDQNNLGLGPYEMGEANELYDMNRAEVEMNAYSGGSTRAQAARERMFRKAAEAEGKAGQMPQTSVPQSWAPHNLLRGLFGYAPTGTPAPSKEDLAALQSGAISPQAFAKKFGLSLQEAESTFLGLKTSVDKKAK